MAVYTIAGYSVPTAVVSGHGIPGPGEAPLAIPGFAAAADAPKSSLCNGDAAPWGSRRAQAGKGGLTGLGCNGSRAGRASPPVWRG